jgi:hypothetical protein
MQRAKKVSWTLPWNYETAEDIDHSLPTLASAGVALTLDEKKREIVAEF